MTNGVNARHGLVDAPHGLVVVQELLNTIASPRPGHEVPDVLETPASTKRWVDGVLGVAGRTTRADVDDLRRLRDEVRAVIHARDAGRPPVSLRAHVGLVLTPDGLVEVEAAGSRADAMRGVVLREILHAQSRGDWTRLKLCAYSACGGAFYDLSRNRSARWDSTECANVVNLRNFRARAAQQTPTPD